MLKKIFLTVTSVLLLSACPSKTAESFPAEDLFITDLQHEVCAHYAIVDKLEFKVKHIEDLPLAVKGPCDAMVGFQRQDYQKIRNWIRDEQKASQALDSDEINLFMTGFDSSLQDHFELDQDSISQ